MPRPSKRRRFLINLSAERLRKKMIKEKKSLEVEADKTIDILYSPDNNVLDADIDIEPKVEVFDDDIIQIDPQSNFQSSEYAWDALELENAEIFDGGQSLTKKQLLPISSPTDVDSQIVANFQQQQRFRKGIQTQSPTREQSSKSVACNNVRMKRKFSPTREIYGSRPRLNLRSDAISTSAEIDPLEDSESMSYTYTGTGITFIDTNVNEDDGTETFHMNIPIETENSESIHPPSLMLANVRGSNTSFSSNTKPTKKSKSKSFTGTGTTIFPSPTKICLICRQNCNSVNPSRMTEFLIYNPKVKKFDVKINLITDAVGFLIKRLLNFPTPKIKEFENIYTSETGLKENNVSLCIICKLVLDNAIETEIQIESLQTKLSVLMNSLKDLTNTKEVLPTETTTKLQTFCKEIKHHLTYKRGQVSSAYSRPSSNSNRIIGTPVVPNMLRSRTKHMEQSSDNYNVSEPQSQDVIPAEPQSQDVIPAKPKSQDVTVSKSKSQYAIFAKSIVDKLKSQYQIFAEPKPQDAIVVKPKSQDENIKSKSQVATSAKPKVKSQNVTVVNPKTQDAIKECSVVLSKLKFHTIAKTKMKQQRDQNHGTSKKSKITTKSTKAQDQIHNDVIEISDTETSTSGPSRYQPLEEEIEAFLIPPIDENDLHNATKLINSNNNIQKKATDGKLNATVDLNLDVPLTETTDIPDVPSPSISLFSDCNNKTPTTMEQSVESPIPNDATSPLPEDISLDPPDELISVAKQKLMTDPKPLKKLKTIFKCGLCNSTFQDQSTLSTHFEKSHNQKPKFKCYNCMKQFDSLALCEAHIRTDHSKPSKQMTSNWEIIKSASSVQKLDANGITEDGRKQSNMKSQYSCLLDVLDIVTDIAPVIKRSNAKTESYKDKKTTAWVCIICGEKFDDQSIYSTHAKKHITTPRAYGAQSTKNNEFPCTVPKCNDKFSTMSDLAIHKICTHKIRYERSKYKDVLSSKPPTIPFKGLKCPEEGCDVYCLTENALANHRVDHHDIKDLIRKCPHCPAEFPYIRGGANVSRHILNAHTEKKQCPSCPTTFVASSKLKNHIKYVHEKAPRPHACKICDKRFISASKLKVHTSIHFDDRPFLCSECGKTFKTHNNLYIHGWSHDPDRSTKYGPYINNATKLKANRLKRMMKKAGQKGKDDHEGDKAVYTDSGKIQSSKNIGEASSSDDIKNDVVRLVAVGNDLPRN